jgi:hypothetical protein
MGGGHSKQAYLIPWGVVEKRYHDKEVKIPVEMIKTHGELKRRCKTYNCASLFDPLRKTRLDSLKNQSTETTRWLSKSNMGEPLIAILRAFNLSPHNPLRNQSFLRGEPLASVRVYPKREF